MTPARYLLKGMASWLGLYGLSRILFTFFVRDPTSSGLDMLQPFQGVSWLPANVACVSFCLFVCLFVCLFICLFVSSVVNLNGRVDKFR